MLDYLDVKSTEQAKVLAHPLRLQIIGLFSDGLPRTSKQLADMMEIAPSKVHYHVRELLRMELIQLVETKEKGGIIEKYYLPVAKEFRVFLKEGEDGTNSATQHSILNTMFDEYKRNFIKSVESNDKQAEDHQDLKDHNGPRIRLYKLLLSDREFTQFQNELYDVLDRWKEYSSNRTDQSSEEIKSFRLLVSHHEHKQKSNKSSVIKVD